MTTTTQPETNLEILLMKSLLKNMGINIKNDILKSFNDNTVVGFFCTASSAIRKATTVKNLQEFISETNLPLVVEIGSEFNNQYKIVIVRKAEAAQVVTMFGNLSQAS